MVVLLAGFLPDPKLETSILSVSCSLNTMWMVHAIPCGLSSAISIRVFPDAARLSVYVSGIVCLAEGLFLAIITVLVQDVGGYLYINKEEVRLEYVAGRKYARLSTCLLMLIMLLVSLQLLLFHLL